ncbi:glycoside hydrolase family 26 protein [Salinimicrobium soli]|uniref:glycoside hydrolase family 26 protein n=1 Tax=Salinimicrobium soli TaxID=1254399 RepID=UPI003AAB8657
MKKIISYLLLACVLIVVVIGSVKAWGIFESKFPNFFVSNKIEKEVKQEVLAVYDPGGGIPVVPQHYRLQIKSYSDWQLDKNELKDAPAEQPVLLTVEIWGHRVLDSIAGGNYNEELVAMLKPLAHRQDLLLRFNPEMEIPQNDNAWSNWGEIYNHAFLKFSETARRILPEAKIVWGPAGALGNMEYFPGKDNFEVASISLDKKDKTDLFLENKELSELLERKLSRMRFLDTPIIILGQRRASQAVKNEVFEEAFRKYEEVKRFTNLDDLQPKAKIERKTTPGIGLYDPQKLLVNNDAVSIEHIFIGLDDIQDGSFKKQFLDILSRKHDVIITVEPVNLKDNPVEPNVLKGIINGNFDELLQKFYQLIPEDGPVVYLRFAHEMEVPVDRYPWQKQDPSLYIKAFRYFMKFPGSEKSNIKKVWAPAGDRGSVEWWPGSDVVDFISMSIYGLPDKNITDYKEQDSFGKIYLRKRRRLDLFGKPFLIAEFGVTGHEEYQKRWMLDAAEVINKHKEIFGVNYFNYQDLPNAWGEIEPPDWSIKKEVFEEFTGAVSNQP